VDIEVEFAFEVVGAELSEAAKVLETSSPITKVYLTELHPK
jgi:hypothetical protein